MKKNLESMPNNKGYIWKDVIFYGALPDENNGHTIIFEKGLDKLLSKNLNKNFTITSNLEYAVINSDITFIAVGTPFHGNSIDLSQVKEAAKSIGKILLKKKDYHLIIVKNI